MKLPDNVFSKALSKKDLYRATLSAEPVKLIVDKEVNCVGISFKDSISSEGEAKLLTFITVNEGGTLWPYFTSAMSMFNNATQVAEVFKDEIEKGNFKLTVRQLKTRHDNTIYQIDV